MNVAETMKAAIPELNKGIDGIRFWLKPECLDSWNEGYAIVDGFYYEYPLDNDYFDHDRFQFDYEQKVKALFPGCEVNFRWRSQEIEVIAK